MGRIRVLDDSLVNRIAAGEVVERPASVVKELVENALDAGARSVEVRLEGGGKRRIIVADDGAGMDRDDALLALERHATSKLGRFEDLEGIGTLGFRGEALPSIAAVSRFRIRTCTGSGEGTEVRCRGGRIDAVAPSGDPRGTTVEVANLFFNVPARRKFLRADGTELGHVARFLTQCALARPDVRFRGESDGRVFLDAPAARDRAERVAQIHGGETAGRLIPFGLERDGMRAQGFAGRPVDALPRRDGQHLFVNGRVVRDRIVSHAVTEAYGDTMPRGRHPSLVLFLDLHPGDVDVNVHPQKTEVRFRRSAAVHDLVRDAIASALGVPRAVPDLRDLRPGGPGGFAPVSAGAEEGSGAPGVRLGEPSRRSEWRAAVAAAGPRGSGAGEAPLGVRRATALGQLRRSYVIAEDEEGLLLVDQHVAHERVLYERYLEAAERDRVEVQRLLAPAVVELTPGERLQLDLEGEELARLGFLIEPFGASAVRLDGVPAVASGLPPESLLRRLLGEAARARSASTALPEIRRKLVTSAACQAAIKVHDPLAPGAMQALLDDLFATKNPTTCPHGRPILFRVTLDEIERAFRRR